MKITRRNTLIGLGGLAGGIGLIGGTGAFDTVQADRDFAVELDGDASALLQLIPLDEDYVQFDGEDNELLEINIGTDDDAGINDNAVTTFNDLFLVANNGTEDVDIWFETGEDVEGVTFKAGDADITGGDENSENIEPGGVREDIEEDDLDEEEGDYMLVSLEIDTTADGGYTEPDDGNGYSITVHASTDE
ncbi:hypothetical protein [Halostagnicola sp. A-GB9-2]|uniref:hypothetical protein n=1 Tax=Halostagnicola sp. A-GB9-2 TaxID=3048066 RepID=UPI0024C018AC|nr:hypothetical protein [Halostagnicola sp. A-GB9-2]MDJ1433730.1 hypothetical protein [Halostagnicola sp. A-GB9-2]